MQHHFHDRDAKPDNHAETGAYGGFDNTNEEQLIPELRHTDAADGGQPTDTAEELRNQPYMPAAPAEQKPKFSPIPLGRLATIAAMIVLVVALFLYVQSVLLPTRVHSALGDGGSGVQGTDQLTTDTAAEKVVPATTLADTGLISTRGPEASGSTQAAGASVYKTMTPPTTSKYAAGKTTAEPSIYYSGGKAPSYVTGVTKGCNGILSMSTDQLKKELDTFILVNFKGAPTDGTSQPPTPGFTADQFYKTMNILNRYTWQEHRDYFNAYTLQAYDITVIGSNTVYTYLVIGRDENGKPFAWSFYDYKVVYLSEADYAAIEAWLLN